MKRLHKIISMFLVWMLCVSMLPVSTLALELPELGVLEDVVEAVEAEEVIEEAEPPEEITAPETTEAPAEVAEEEYLVAEAEQESDVLLASSGTCGENLTWTLDDEGTLTISGTGAMIATKQFSYIGTIGKVVIESGVTSIGDYAFYYCDSLTSVTIPDSVTSIGNYAFKKCDNLTSITIPDSVTSIGIDAFSWCSSLTSINIPDSVASIGYDAFERCDDLTSVYITDLAAWCAIDFANYFAQPLYWANNLYLNGELVTNLAIPDNVTSIGNYAFYNCDSLISVTIPDNATTIGNSAFENCDNIGHVCYPGTDDAWNSINIGSDNEALLATPRCRQDAICYDKCTIVIGHCTGCNIYFGTQNKPQATHIYRNGICRLCGLSDQPGFDYSIAYNGDVTILKYHGSSSEVVIPSTIEGLPVTTIGSSAFYNCDSLTSVTIPDSVTSIGNSAFKKCDNLTNVYITDIAAWCSIIFDDNYANPLYYADNFYLNGEPVTTLTIPDGVTSIGSNAFYNCDNLTSITIPGSVTSIGMYAFHYCDNLTNVYITDIAAWCSIIFDDNYANPLYYADNFYLNGELVTTLTIPDGVTSIGSNAFYNCDNLISVTIPESVTSIGMYAFHYCDNLTNVYITDIAAWCSIIFYDNYANPLYYADNLYLNGELVTTLTIPDGVTSIGSNAFYNCDSLTSVTIPDSVTSIGNSAFSDCDSLINVHLGSGIKTITSTIFNDCSSMKALTLHNSVTAVEQIAFEDCTSLEHVLFIGTEDEWWDMSVGSGNDAFDIEPCYGEEGDTITYHKEGSTSYLYCSACGKKFAEKTHSFGDWYVSKVATCSETGERRRDCTDCEYYETEVIVTVAHTWDTGMITREPALNVDGVKTYTCSGCGGTKAESIPAIHYDVTNNGFTDARDVVALMKHLIGAETAANADALDVNGDDKVDILDVVRFVRLLA